MVHNPDNWPIDEYTVDSVIVDSDGGLTITANPWTFGLSPQETEGRPTPRAGDPVVLLGGLGRPIRGVFINGVQYRYVTREEADQQHQEWLANYKQRKQDDFDKNIDTWLSRKDALDEPFRSRIQRFEDQDFVEFWRESGAYELFTVEQANKLYNTAPEDNKFEWLDYFYGADWDQQKEMFPELDEGHSGNTFGGMVALAKAVAEGREI